MSADEAGSERASDPERAAAGRMIPETSSPPPASARRRWACGASLSGDGAAETPGEDPAKRGPAGEEPGADGAAGDSTPGEDGAGDGASADEPSAGRPGAAPGGSGPGRDRPRAPLVFLAYPKAHVALASAIFEALSDDGYRIRPGPPIEEWPIEAWTGADRLELEDAAARDEAQAVVVVWSEDPALDPTLRYEADVALSRIALAAVVAPKKAVPRLPTRYRAKLLAGSNGVEAVASAVAAHLSAGAESGRDRSAEPGDDPVAALEERVRRLSDLGLREEALEARRAVVDHRRRLFDAAPNLRRARTLGRRLGAAAIDLAERLAELGRDAEAAKTASAAADLMRRMRDEHGLAADIALARALTIAAQCRARTRRWAAAAAALDEAVAIYRRLHLAHPALARPRLALLLGRVAEARLGENRRLDAETAAMESLSHFRALARSGEGSDLENLAEALERLCEIQLALSRPAAAAAAAAEAVELYREAGAGEEDLAPALLRHGRALVALKRTDEALSHLTEATSLARSLADIDPDEFRPLLGEALGEVAETLLKLGRPGEAAEFATQGLEAIGPEAGGAPRALLARARPSERLAGEDEAQGDARALRRRLLAAKAAPVRRRRYRAALAAALIAGGAAALGATLLAALGASGLTLSALARLLQWM